MLVCRTIAVCPFLCRPCHDAAWNRKKKRRALRKALAEQVATEALAPKKQASCKGKTIFRGTSLPPRPYKKWSDDKLDKIIMDMNTKISIMDDKVQMYNIRLRAYKMEKNHREEDQ